jgi:hypothetical protein
MELLATVPLLIIDDLGMVCPMSGDCSPFSLAEVNRGQNLCGHTEKRRSLKDE